MALGCLAGGCGDGSSAMEPDPPDPSTFSLELLSGQGQTGAVTEILPEPIRIQVRDSSGAVVRDSVLEFSVTEGGGRVMARMDRDSTIWEVRWELGPRIGEQELLIENPASPDPPLRVAATGTSDLRIAALTDGFAVEGVRIRQPLTATGGSGTGYTWSLLEGPAEFSLESGVLVGTPGSPDTLDLELRVTDSRGTFREGTFTLPVCPLTTLAPGEAATATLPLRCDSFLADEGRYRVAIMGGEFERISERDGTVPAVHLLLRSVEPEEPLLGELDVARAFRSSRERRLADPLPREGDPVREREFATHLEWPRDTDVGRFHRARGATPESPRVRPGPSLGEVRRFQVSRRDTAVDAELIFISEHVLYYQDTGAPDEGEDTDLAKLAEMVAVYEDWGVPVIDDVFGGLGPPGTTDVFAGKVVPAADLDQNGRLIILQVRPSIRQNINWVSPCDKLPRPENARSDDSATCARSNEGEVVYLQSPNISVGGVAAVLIHEVKHVSSAGWRIYGPDVDPESSYSGWVEEGTAHVASDLASRRALGLGPADQAGFEDLDLTRVIPVEAYGMAQAAVTTRVWYFNKLDRGMGRYGNSGYTFFRFLADQLPPNQALTLFTELNRLQDADRVIAEIFPDPLETLTTHFLTGVMMGGASNEALAGPAPRFRSYDWPGILDPLSQGNPWPGTVYTGSYEDVEFEWPQGEDRRVAIFEVKPAENFLRLAVRRSTGSHLTEDQPFTVTVVRIE